MDLSLTPSQILIRDSARAFVRRHVPRTELVRQANEGETWDPNVMPNSLLTSPKLGDAFVYV